MTEASALSWFLETGGGWALSAVLMLVVWYLYRDIQKLHRDRRREVDERNTKLFDLIEKRIETDVRHQEAFKSLQRLVEKLLERGNRG